MKRIFGIALAAAFLITAAAHAQTQANPAEKAPAPTAQKVEAAPTVKPEAPVAKAAEVKDTQASVTDLCKRKGLAGTALDECVKGELAKAEIPKAPAVNPAPAPKPATK